MTSRANTLVRTVRVCACILVLFVSSCAVDSGQSDTQLGHYSLTAPGLTPVPCANNKISWRGTRVQLLFADAAAACVSDDIDFAGEFSNSDRVFQNVITRISEVMPPTGLKPLSQWVEFRATKANNCDPDNPQLTRSVGIEPTPVKESFVDAHAGAWGASFDLANTDLRWAGINLCIAQHLRSLAPGTAGAEALLMSNSEQLELLETTRERAQIAMLHYALLGSVFASNGDGTAPICPPTPNTGPCAPDLVPYRVPYLQWFGHNAPTGVLENMGRDFATSVQLHSDLTEEVLGLLARSRSARLPHGGAPETRADETWGATSWQQRLMLAAYGGDPLAARGGTPWRHPAGIGTPATGWPDKKVVPYVGVDSDDPRSRTALALLQHFDLLDLTASGRFQQCPSIDVASSASKMYDALERRLRETLCLDFDPVTESCSSVAIPADPDEHALWRYARVRREHVDTVAQQLADAIGPQLDLSPFDPAAGSPCPYQRYGSHVVDGDLTLGANGIHLSPTARLVPRPPADLSGTYSKNSHLRLATATDLDPLAPSHQQGFSTDYECVELFGICNPFLGRPGGLAAEAERTMGAIPAMAAVRDLVVIAVERLGSLGTADPQRARLDDYFQHSAAIDKIVSTSVGTSVTLRPVTTFDATSKTLVVSGDSQGSPRWSASVIVDSQDDFWSEPVNGELLVLLAAPNDGWAATFAQAQNAHVFGRNAAERFLASLLAGHFAVLSPATNSSVVHLVSAGPMPLKSSEKWWTFYAWRGTGPQLINVFNGNVDGRFAIVANGVRTRTDDGTPERVAEYFAHGGATGGWVARQMLPDDGNPAEPAYDGFGLPHRWVPPTNSEILGGQASVPAFRYYLDAADTAAKDATDAVDKAVEGLLAQQLDEAQLQAESQKSALLMKQASQELCGYDNPSCSVSTTETNVLGAWYPALKNFPAPTEAECQAALNAPQASSGSAAEAQAAVLLGCIARASVERLLSTRFALASPLNATLTLETSPTFADYKGGQLQSAFVEQWQAIRAPDDRFDLLKKQIAASLAAIKTASKVLYKANLLRAHNCGVDDFVKDIAKGAATGAAQGAVFGPGGIAVGAAWGANDAYEQHMEKCSELAADIGVAEASQMQAVKTSLLNVTSVLSGLGEDQARIIQSGVAVDQLVNSSRLERERYALELDLLGQTQTTSFGLYRRYRAYDAWRAKALLDSARRYALTARRGIESHYVADLSRLSQNEPFVASPATWADGVYEYDLSLPAAVGSTVGDNVPGGIFANKVSDYVSNLRAFVDGFAVQRPSAVAGEDVDIVTLKGLAPGDPVPFDTGTETISLFPDVGVWQVQCPPQGITDAEWRAVPAAELGGVTVACADFAGCGCPPEDFECITESSCDVPRALAARTVFQMDPWGRLDSTSVVQPFSVRYNARWTRMAVNLVGTGLRDCQKAPDPATCYSQAFLPFNLRHFGTPIVTDFTGDWWTFKFPPGRIESGKALAAELWLDPLKDGWNTSYVGAVSRSELYWRPFGGKYELELQAGPDVRLERLERIQILVGSSYWVAQQ